MPTGKELPQIRLSHLRAQTVHTQRTLYNTAAYWQQASKQTDKEATK